MRGIMRDSLGVAKKQETKHRAIVPLLPGRRQRGQTERSASPVLTIMTQTGPLKSRNRPKSRPKDRRKVRSKGLSRLLAHPPVLADIARRWAYSTPRMNIRRERAELPGTVSPHICRAKEKACK